MRRANTYLNTLLSCARQLRSGVTTVVDVHSTLGGAEAYAAAVDGRLRAYEVSGIRAAYVPLMIANKAPFHWLKRDRTRLSECASTAGGRGRSMISGRPSVVGKVRNAS